MVSLAQTQASFDRSDSADRAETMKLLFDTKYILCIRDTETLTVMDRLMCQLKAGTFLVTGVRPADFNVRTEKPEFIVIFSRQPSLMIAWRERQMAVQ